MKKLSTLLWATSLIITAVILPTNRADAAVHVKTGIQISLPSNSTTITVGKKHYHYHRGAYYRKVSNKYVIVEAPQGAFIRKLPNGYKRVKINRVSYFTYNGTYYKKSTKGYIVVKRPMIKKRGFVVLK